MVYRWHPWWGQRVAIVQDYVRGGRRVVRCRDDLGQIRELPFWMLDRAACCGMNSAYDPVVDVDDLRQLQELLRSWRGDGLEERHFLSSFLGDAEVPPPPSPQDSPARSVPPTTETAAVGRTATRYAAQDASGDRVVTTLVTPDQQGAER